MGKLLNKTLLITGASSGIGEAIAYEAAEEDATVILCARREKELQRVKANYEKLTNQPAYVYPLDISDPTEIESVMREIQSTVGDIDVLINNAGFGYTKEFLNFNMETAESMFRVNVLGLMYMSQLVALEMAERKAGHIINVASLAGKMATPKAAVYAATKHAVIGFSNALRLELKPLNIQVTTVNPGPVDTPFFDQFDPERNYFSSIDWIGLTDKQVAQKTVKVVGTKKREVNMPLLLSGASKFYYAFPTVGDFLVSKFFNKK